MSFDPRRFLTVARRLVKDLTSDDQAALRTSVGRTYYAAYWVARDWVEHHTGRVNPSHGETIGVLQRQRRLSGLGDDLQYLFRARELADYNRTARFTRSKVRRLHRRAAAFIKALDTAR